MEKFKITHYKLLLISLILLLLSCKDEHIDKSSIINLQIKNIKNISFPDEYESGLISKVVENDNGNLFFIDFSKRQVLKFETETNNVVALTNIGRGPSDFLFPSHIDFTQNGRLFAISDVSTTDIKLLREDGSFHKLVPHKYAGKRFVLSEHLIYIKGELDSLVQIIDFSGESVESILSPSPEYSSLSKYFYGGGIVKIDSLLFVMNSLEPKIYILNLNDLSNRDYLSPSDWEKFKNNLIIEELLYESRLDIIKEKYNNPIYLDLLRLKINDIDFIVVIYSLNKSEYINILSMRGEVVFKKKMDIQIVGSKNNKLFGFDNNSIEKNPLKVLEFSILKTNKN